MNELLYDIFTLFRTFARANQDTRPVTTAQQPHAGWAGMRSDMSAQIAADLAVEAARHVAVLRRAANKL